LIVSAPIWQRPLLEPTASEPVLQFADLSMACFFLPAPADMQEPAVPLQ
jgi:hypothetical protein